MKQSYETQAILNDARVGVNKIYISKEVREEKSEDIYNLIVNDECVIPKEYWVTVISRSGEETTKKGVGDIWSNCISLSGGGSGGDIPIGTDRQLLGFEDGALAPETLGWRHFSDLPNPPTFNTGILSGTTFNPDGSAMFYFHELNDAVNASAKALTIPVYTTNGRLNVGTPVDATNAVTLAFLRTLVPTGGTATTFLRGDGTWVTPTNTTYTVISEAEATAGTATTARAVSADSLKRDILNRTKTYNGFTEVNSSITLAKVHADRNKPILCTGGSILTFTIPTSATASWVVGDVIEIYNNHGANLIIDKVATVDVSSVDDMSMVSSKGWCKLVCISANQWSLTGDLTTT